MISRVIAVLAAAVALYTQCENTDLGKMVLAQMEALEEPGLRCGEATGELVAVVVETQKALAECREGRP